MHPKVLLWKTLFRFGKHASKIRSLAKETGLPVRVVQDLVAKIEEDSVDLARYVLQEAKRKAEEDRKRERPRNVTVASSGVVG